MVRIRVIAPPDAELCEAVSAVERGLIDADLGGGVIKQRISRPATPAFRLADSSSSGRAPCYKPLSVGIVLLDLDSARHQPDLFAADTQRRQKLSPVIDGINGR